MGVVFNVAVAAIANGAALSNAVFLGSGILVGIQIPGAWTAASLTYQVSVDQGATWGELYDDAGNEVTTVVPGVSTMLAVTSALFAPGVAIKVRSGTSAAPVNQGQAVSLILVTRKTAFI
jgi:hypothetical protein